MSELGELINGSLELVRRENVEGGDLRDCLCPFCGRPRSQRSDYVRCQPCGVNWWPGTDLKRNPHLSGARTQSLTQTQEKRTDAG
jgi:hypothetical protein